MENSLGDAIGNDTIISIEPNGKKKLIMNMIDMVSTNCSNDFTFPKDVRRKG